MEDKLYTASGQFETGTEIATFDRCREGLNKAYEWVFNACNWQIKCGSELVSENDPWGDPSDWEEVDESILDEGIV